MNCIGRRGLSEARTFTALPEEIESGSRRVGKGAHCTVPSAWAKLVPACERGSCARRAAKLGLPEFGTLGAAEVRIDPTSAVAAARQTILPTPLGPFDRNAPLSVLVQGHLGAIAAVSLSRPRHIYELTNEQSSSIVYSPCPYRPSTAYRRKVPYFRPTVSAS
jgi:hypothetical protein